MQQEIDQDCAVESYQEWKSVQLERNEEYNKITVPHKAPLVLQVTVVNGREISRSSILNLVDKPNPQIALEYPPARGKTKFSTAAIIDDVTPEWNETFTFVLPEDHDEDDLCQKAEIKFFLIVEDWHDSSDCIAEATYSPSKLRIGEDEIEEIIDFGKKGNITIRIKKELRQNTDIRFSLALGKDEMDYRLKRIPKVMCNMQNVLGQGFGPQDLFETPVMSVIGSGGGFRAMVGMVGVMEALEETGLLDCITYAIGTSGSAWYMSSAYAWHALKKERQAEFHKWFKTAMKSSLKWDMLNPDNTLRFRNVASKKVRGQQPVTLVDYYGYCVGSHTLGGEYEMTKFSDMKEYVKSADVPFPLLTTLQVHKSVDTWNYHADCTLSPFEVEVPHYGLNFDMRLFNSEFYAGVVNQKLEEPPLRYIQGMVGSIFALRLAKVFNLPDDEEDKDFFQNVHEEIDMIRPTGGGILDALKSKVVEWFDKLPDFMDRGFFINRDSRILNFGRGHKEQRRFTLNPHHITDPVSTKLIEGLSPDEDVISIVDTDGECMCECEAGRWAAKAHLPSLKKCFLMNPVDYLKSSPVLDLSVHDIHKISSAIKAYIAKTLLKAVTLARKGGLKFPPIDFDKIKREALKELYVFEDPDDLECPIVFYFYLCTTTFKKIKNYRAKDRSFFERIFEIGSEFTNFDVIGSQTYSTYSLSYEERDFERLKELMWFNVIFNVELIKRKIHQKILQKRSLREQRRR